VAYFSLSLSLSLTYTHTHISLFFTIEESPPEVKHIHMQWLPINKLRVKQKARNILRTPVRHALIVCMECLKNEILIIFDFILIKAYLIFTTIFKLY